MKTAAICLGIMALGADARLRDLAKQLRKEQAKLKQWGTSTVEEVVDPSSGSKNRTTTEEDYWKQWGEFQAMSGNVYLTQAHHDKRFEIFKDNIDKINRHNALGLSWWMGVTQFADLTEQEFKDEVVGGCTLPDDRPRNEYVFTADELADTPDSIDWTQRNMVTPVKNQGQCGSCWAFSTTGAVEARYAIAKGKLNSLSEQELVDCGGVDGNNGCRGGLMDYGFTYVQQQNGLCLEADFPYKAKDDKRDCEADRSACQHYDAITGYQDVKKNSADQLEAAVKQGPVSIAIEADQSTFQLYRGGVLTAKCGKKLDHGVLLVGYDNTAPQKFWKVKNSWGETWGEQGYIRLGKDINANCGAFGGCAGQCGLLGQPSYPVVGN